MLRVQERPTGVNFWKLEYWVPTTVVSTLDSLECLYVQILQMYNPPYIT